MKSLIRTIMIGIFAGGILLTSCTKEYVVPTVVDVPDTVSFAANIVPIFDQSCNMPSCHTRGGIAPNLDADLAYSNLWLYGMLDTFQADASLLYTRMNSTSKPMPPEGRLSDGVLNLVLTWIEQGAKDN